MDENNVSYDVSGYDYVTDALKTLLNEYPGLGQGEKINFSMLPSGYGKAMFPTSGAIIQSERESITGHVTQECLYPFNIVFRASGLTQNNRSNAKEWLDKIGMWLEKQPVIIGETQSYIQDYPVISGDREFRRIYRQTPAYLNNINEDKSEDWMIAVVAMYRNEFDR